MWLAKAVPTTYSSWRITIAPGDRTLFSIQDGVSALQWVCEGIDTCRHEKGLGLLCLKLSADEAGRAQARGMELSLEHVGVTVCEWWM